MAVILLVDDDPMIRATLSIALRADGHDVLLAGNGREAMAQIARRRPDRPIDLVITDIIMPEADGLEVILNCRKAFPETRIIAMSGGGRVTSMDFLDTAEKFGASATLAKPFTPDILTLTVAHVLSQDR